MAKRPIYRYEPNNSNPDKAVGVVLPFNKPYDARQETLNFLSGSRGSTSLFVQSYTTEEQSISNLKNLLLTRKGERYMQPDFGTRINDALFEPNTEVIAEDLQLSLEEDIAFWLPYITIKQIEVVRDINNYSLSIRIRYIAGSSLAERVIIVLANENEILLSDINGPLELSVSGYI